MKKTYKAILIAFAFISLFIIKFMVASGGTISSAATFI